MQAEAEPSQSAFAGSPNHDAIPGIRPAAVVLCRGKLNEMSPRVALSLESSQILPTLCPLPFEALPFQTKGIG